MKTAISIPDSLFEAAERTARRLGLSRSELYVRALERFLADESDDAITSQLDAVYADEDSPIDDDLRAAQHRAVAEVW